MPSGGLRLGDPNQDTSFKVVDRRLFTAEGELRKEAVEEERREQQAAAAEIKGTKTGTGASTQRGAGPKPTEAPAAPPEETNQPSHNFQLLIDLLTRNAAALLGGMADPRTGKAFVDLEGAREIIDMLDVLREKTRGNLASEDEQLLLEVIGSLKLTYMEVSRAAADAMREKVKSKS